MEIIILSVCVITLIVCIYTLIEIVLKNAKINDTANLSFIGIKEVRESQRTCEDYLKQINKNSSNTDIKNGLINMKDELDTQFKDINTAIVNNYDMLCKYHTTLGEILHCISTPSKPKTRAKKVKEDTK